LTAKIFAEYKDYDVYTKQEVGTRVELGRTFGDLQIAAFVQAKHVLLEDYDISAASLGPPEYDVASTGLAATYDRRDNKVLPHSGYIVSASAEVAPELLSVSFARAVLKGGYYIPWGRSTFMLLGQGGVIYPLGDGDLPIDERFFNGGANTVRSFNEREMGPQDPNGEHIGGEAYTAFTAEWDFPLVGDLYGAVFVDAGNLLPLAEDFGLSNMRYALGMGLRYYLPIGPVRFDVALNPDPEEGETNGSLHFGFGFSF
jgi:outer membrane protein assembly factor BamA